jgi:hypothetical protein
MPTLTPILNLGGQPTGLLGMGGRLSSDAFSNLGAAASDLFAGAGAATSARLQAAGLRIRAQGDLAEATNYDLASKLARENEEYTKISTDIQQAQLDRKISGVMGGEREEVASAGFAESGSALDILRDSSAQGSIAKSTLTQQGLMTEAGYEEQAQSFDTMPAAARQAATAEMGIASETEAAGNTARTGSYITAALRGAAAIATLL